MNRRIFGLVAVIASVSLLAPQVPRAALADSPRSGASTTAPVRGFYSLSAHERANLPDGTLVSVGKRILTLGALRAIHHRFVGRVGRASSAASRAVHDLNGSKPELPTGLVLSTAISANAATLTLPTSLPVVEPKGAYSGMAREMQVFCDQAQATVCLYLPGGLSKDTYEISGSMNGLTQIDPWITNQSDCQDLGGGFVPAQDIPPEYYWGMKISDGGTQPAYCLFNFMLSYTAKFKVNPSWMFTTQTDCDSKYWKVQLVDPSGQIHVEPKTSNFATSDSGAWCLVRATLQPKPKS
jgi:hypothetical protein